MSEYQKPVLVISVSSGENEVNQSIESIFVQKDIEFDFLEIRDLGNIEAHELLYSTIMQNANDFSYFVKVDGDMVFSRESVLCEMILQMRNDVEIDHGVFSVLDWYTQKAIMGMHIFSSRCQWTKRDPLFTDSGTNFIGRRELFWDSPAPVAYHSPNPGLMQAFQFGYHRCLKILQRDRFFPKLGQSQFQFNLLKNLYEQYLINRDIRRKAALYGACEAMKRGAFKTFDTRAQFCSYNINVEKIANRKCEIDRRIEKNWGMGTLKQNIVCNPILLSPWFRFNLCSLLRVLHKAMSFAKTFSV